MNYVRVSKELLHLRWKHVKGSYSVVQICYHNTPVAQGNYTEMRNLLNEIRESPSKTTPINLDFKPPPMKPKNYDNRTKTS